MDIYRYGDVGTPQRHAKFGGVLEDIVEGQPRSKVEAEDCLDALFLARVLNKEQFDACYQLCRDYKIGCMYKWRIVRDYLCGSGLSGQDAEFERETCRKSFYAAIRYNSEFIQISDLSHIVLGQVGVRIPAPWKMQQLSERLINYYCNCPRIEIQYNPSPL